MNSIQKASDGTETISAIQLLATGNKEEVFIIVEGDDDISFYNKFKDNNVEIMKAPQTEGGWFQIYKFLESKQYNHPRYIGIRDADFLFFTDEKIPERVFCTDYHDSEMFIISSNETWESIFVEIFQGKREESIAKRETIFEILQNISRAKLVNFKEDLKLNFSSVNFTNSDFFTIDSPTIKFSDYLNKLNSQSTNKTRELTEEEIASKFALNGEYAEKLNQIPENDLPFMLHNGHDFFQIVQALSQKRCRGALKPNAISSIARAAYTKEEFKKTTLFKEIAQYSMNYGLSFFQC